MLAVHRLSKCYLLCNDFVNGCILTRSIKILVLNNKRINLILFFQPTAEQMRMAEIMDTKKDDLALKDKIKQVRFSKKNVWLFFSLL